MPHEAADRPLSQFQPPWNNQQSSHLKYPGTHQKTTESGSQKEEKIRRPSYPRLAGGFRQDPWHIPKAQQQLPPWNLDRAHLTGKDTREETKTRLWTSNHGRSPHLKKVEPREGNSLRPLPSQREAGRFCWGRGCRRCASQSNLALSSSLLAHFLLFPACPCPSPTIMHCRGEVPAKVADNQHQLLACFWTAWPKALALDSARTRLGEIVKKLLGTIKGLPKRLVAAIPWLLEWFVA